MTGRHYSAGLGFLFGIIPGMIMPDVVVSASTIGSTTILSYKGLRFTTGLSLFVVKV